MLDQQDRELRSNVTDRLRRFCECLFHEPLKTHLRKSQTRKEVNCADRLSQDKENGIHLFAGGAFRYT
jgi:hypothetical protein